MREILFRAKAINRIPGREYRTKYKNGDWVYGLLVKPRYPEFPELPAEMRNTDGVSGIEVDFDTIGQYTGLMDKNGVKVFEGDIVRDITERYISKEKKFFGIAVVKFGKHEVQSEDPFCYGDAYGWYFDGNTVRETPIQYYGYNEYERDERYQFEVVGNIYDNPELLGGDDDA